MRLRNGTSVGRQVSRSPTRETMDVDSRHRSNSGVFSSSRSRDSDFAENSHFRHSSKSRLQVVPAEASVVSSLEQQILSLQNIIELQNRRLALLSGPDRLQHSNVRLQPSDGKNIRGFLDTAEIVFDRENIPREEWGEHLSGFLKDEAQRFWAYLKRSNSADMTDWRRVRQRFEFRFCSNRISDTVRKISELHWSGNHVAYCGAFSEIVSSGAVPDAQTLVNLFLARLPREIVREITKCGKLRFNTWEEAAEKLNDTQTDWENLVEILEQSNQYLSASDRRSRRIFVERGSIERNSYNGVRLRPREDVRTVRLTENSNAANSCELCKGRGHEAHVCPVKNPAFVKQGKTCAACGGLHHFARDCPSQQRREAPPTSQAPATESHPNVKA